MDHTPLKEPLCPPSDESQPQGTPLTQKYPFLVPLLSFSIPFFLMMLAFALCNVYPFGIFSGDAEYPNGNEQILNFDLWHQYYPFLQIFQEKLQEGGSLFYTWITGMGANFLSLTAYYIASPLNLLTILLPSEILREALTFGVLIKVGLAGLFFSIFAKKALHRADGLALLLSCCYALSNYATGYYWNVMWMDVFAVFPLVMLGTHELFVHSKFKLYTVTVALSLLMNYYIGYMVCVFVAITFFAYAVIYKVDFKVFLRKLCLFAIFSLLACMLSGVLTVPAFLGLQTAHGASGNFHNSFSVYRGFEDLFAALFSFHNPTGIDGLPNICCGVICVVLTFFFFWNVKFSLREKLTTLLVLLFLFLSLNVNVLDYFWHGFHFPNQVPHRFGFILSFCLVAVALRSLSKTEHMDRWDVIGSGVFTGLFLLSGGVAVLRSDDPLFTDNVLDGKLILVINVALCAFYLLLLCLKQKKQVQTRGFALLLGFMMLVELIPAAVLGVKAVGTTSHSGYEYNHANTHDLLQYARERDPEGVNFYRLDFTEGWSCNDPALYGYNGISQFSSAANASVTEWMHALGLPADEASNRYAYEQNTPVTNAFLNLKYLMHKQVSLKDKNYLTKLTTHGGISLYENTAYLPLGFMTGSDITQLKPDKIQIFRTQNQLFRLASGLNRDVFIPLTLTSGEHKGMTLRPVNDTDGGYTENYNFRYDVISGSTEVDLVMEGTATANGTLYGYLTVPGAENAQIKINGLHEREVILEKDRVKQAAVYLGEVESGDTVTISCKVDSVYINGYCNLQTEILDKEAFEEGLALLKDEILVLSEFTDTSVKGQVTALTDGVLYTSIPYESGWTATVDGQKAATVAIGGALVGIPLSAGAHTVELSYSPNGFTAGLILTAVALIAFVALILIQAKRPFLPCDTLVLPPLAEKKPAESQEQESQEQTSQEQESQEEEK